MSDLEQAARQALEALKLLPPMAWTQDTAERNASAITALRQALEQPKQEPVRWMYDWKNDGLTVTDWVTSDKGEAYSPTKGHFNIRPLYTEPQRKPLTDEQIEDLYFDNFSIRELKEFARAIEAAHGIGEKK